MKGGRPETRLFIAIDPPRSQQLRIKEICCDLPGARWVAAEQLHLTLRFIGEVDSGMVGRIVDELAGVETEPLTLQIKGVGSFPAGRAPRVLWLGLEADDRLDRLQKRIEAAVVRLGLALAEQKFFAHLTLARLKNSPTAAINAFLADHARFELEPFPVPAFGLFSSQLSGAGAHHQLLASYPLER